MTIKMDKKYLDFKTVKKKALKGGGSINLFSTHYEDSGTTFVKCYTKSYMYYVLPLEYGAYILIKW